MMNCLYILIAMGIIYAGGRLAEHIQYLAMKRTQDKYNAMQAAYKAHLEREYLKGK